MDLKELKDLLLKRLHIELQLFKDSILRQSKEEVYKSSYKIEVFVNSYEILVEDMERLDEDTVRGLLYQNFGILDFLYQEWLTREIRCIRLEAEPSVHRRESLLYSRQVVWRFSVRCGNHAAGGDFKKEPI